MPINSKLESRASKELKFLIKSREVADVIVFGSAVKGKAIPRDIDVAVVFYSKPTEELEEKLKEIRGLHISILTAKDFFINAPFLVNVLLREGYSIKNRRFLSENLKFLSRVLFKYDLASLSASTKVRTVNILHGKIRGEGLVEKNKGEWIANQVFFVPVSADKLFEEFFSNFKIRYKKFYVLIH